MQLIKTNESIAGRRRVFVHLVDGGDGITAETGEGGGQAQVSANGGSFTDTAATLVAVGSGLYYVELTQAEVNFSGFGAVRYKSAATAEAQVLFQTTALDFYGGGLGGQPGIE